MLTSLRAYKDATNFMEFVIGQSTSYEVKKITGLGPTPTQVTHIPMVDLMGEHAFQSSNVTRRTIAITLGLKSTNVSDIQAQRQALYDFFPPFTKVTLRFYDSVREPVFVDGWVESCAPSIFSNEPEMIVTVACPDAYFSALNRTTRSNISAAGTHVFNNLGNADIGIDFTVTFAAASAGVLKFYEENSSERYFRVASANAALSRAVSMAPGTRKIVNGTTQFLAEVDPGSTWFLLHPGENRLVFELNGVSSVHTISWLHKWSSL